MRCRTLRCFFLISFFSFIAAGAVAQYYNQRPEFLKANSVWAFPKGAGLNFNSGTPLSFQTAPAMLNVEGSASVADPVSGQLLFYSNGRICWNRNNQPMPNGSGLIGNSGGSAAQGACIVPVIDSPGKYYLFSLYGISGGTSVWNQEPPVIAYSVIDMNLNSGLGDIVSGRKNIPLNHDTLSECMIAVPGDNCDVWLIVHDYMQSAYLSYHITWHGIDTVPVVSPAGTPLPGLIFGSYKRVASVSPDRSRIVVSSIYSGPGTSLSLYKFNPATGMLYDGIDIGQGLTTYAATFSPDNSKIYTVHSPAINTHNLLQFNITTYTTAAINASQVMIASGISNFSYLRLYRDTIYMTTGDNSFFLNTINQPNVSGSSCGYQPYAVGLFPGSRGTLPTEVIYPLPPDTAYTVINDPVDCYNGVSISKTLSVPGFRNYTWDNNTTDSVRTLTDTGTYWLRYQEECLVHVDTFKVYGILADTLLTSRDTVICTNGGVFPVVTLSLTGYSDYRWQDGSTDSTYTCTVPGKYMVSYRAGCTYHTDTIHVQQTDISFSLGNDTTLCSAAQYKLTAPEEPGFAYRWQDGSNENDYTVTAPGSFWLQVSKETCHVTDTVEVYYKRTKPDLGADLMLCQGTPFMIRLNPGTEGLSPNASITWSTGNTGPELTATETGTYWVQVIDLPCSGSDTVKINTQSCACNFNIPNAFSPNSDGSNDIFMPVIDPLCSVKNYRLNIYNRYGQRIFSSVQQNKGWDGTFNGSRQDAGSYFFEVRFEGGSKHIQYYRKGDLTLVR